MDSSWQRQLMRGNVSPQPFAHCLHLSRVLMRTKTLASNRNTIGEHSICKRIFSINKTRKGKKKFCDTKNQDCWPDTKCTQQVHGAVCCANGKYVGVLHQQSQQCDYVKDFETQKFFFSSCGVPGHWRTHKLCKGSLYFEPKSSHKSNKRNLKKFVSHKWLSCNHFGLHQRKSFASIYCNNPQLFTDDRQNTKKYSLSHFIPDRNRNRTEPCTIFFSYCSRIPWNGCCLENRHAYTRKKWQIFRERIDGEKSVMRGTYNRMKCMQNRIKLLKVSR